MINGIQNKIFIDQVKDLELQVSNFKITNAIIHYDETSPYLHICWSINKNSMRR